MRMRIYYTLGRMLDCLTAPGAALLSPALLQMLLKVPLACFRTFVFGTRVCSYLQHGSCYRSCVSQLLALAAPITYTNSVCAEGLHFSAFH